MHLWIITIGLSQRHKEMWALVTAAFLAACTTTEPGVDPPEPKETSVEETLIEKNQAIAGKLDSYAERIDLFFAKERLITTENKTTLKLYNPLKFSEGGQIDFSPHFGLMLHLPNTQKRFKVRFTSYDEDATSVGTNKRSYREPSNEKKYGTSVEFIQELGSVRTTFRPRIEYADKVLTSYLITFLSTVDHAFWSFEPEFQLFARSDVGTGQFLSLNTTFLIDRANGLRLINEEQYVDGNNTFTTNHGFEVKHLYNAKLEQLYTLLFQTSNRETFHNELIILRSQFSHKLQPEILHYSLTPVLKFPKDRAFRFRAELNLDMTVIF